MQNRTQFAISRCVDYIMVYILLAKMRLLTIINQTKGNAINFSGLKEIRSPNAYIGKASPAKRM